MSKKELSIPGHMGEIEAELVSQDYITVDETAKVVAKKSSSVVSGSYKIAGGGMMGVSAVSIFSMSDHLTMHFFFGLFMALLAVAFMVGGFTSATQWKKSMGRKTMDVLLPDEDNKKSPLNPVGVKALESGSGTLGEALYNVNGAGDKIMESVQFDGENAIHIKRTYRPASAVWIDSFKKSLELD